MALHVPEMCFRPGMTGKELEIFERHTCLWSGAQVWFRHKWIELVTASPSLHCIDGYKCARYLSDVFLCCVSDFRLKFSVLNFDGNVCNWIPKTTWPWTDWFWGFLFKNGFFHWPRVFMDWNLKELLICYSFWRLGIFSMFRLRSILVCSLKTLILFRRRILQYRLISFRKAMQIYLVAFRVFHSSCFLGSFGKTLWFVLKII